MFISFDCCSGVVWREEEEAEVNIPGLPWLGELDDVRKGEEREEFAGLGRKKREREREDGERKERRKKSEE